MRIGDVSIAELRARLVAPGVFFNSGPFTVALQSDIESVAPALALLYRDFPFAAPPAADFHVSIVAARGLLGRLTRRIEFHLDWESVFAPCPAGQAVPVLEWGLNWCIYANVNHLLVTHAAVVQRDQVTCVLPGASGAGKSTLCAALVLRGWRLLSDELALFSLGDGSLLPLARPIALKNESIDLIAAYSADAVFAPRVATKRKGMVAHMRPPTASVARIEEPAVATHVIFPRYDAGSPASFTPVPKARAFYLLADASLNYTVLRRMGFDLLAAQVERCVCASFLYSQVDDAVAAFDRL